MQLPRVLVIDVNAWRNDAPSNTLMEIFRSWEPDSLALIYTSSSLPYTEVCNTFFQISESQVLKSLFKPWKKVGKRVFNERLSNNSDIVAEKRLRSLSQKSLTLLIRIARELVWKFGRWKTPALRDFIEDFKPDILFIPIFPYAYMGRIEQYVIGLSNKPTVCYLADDNYSYDSCQTILDYIHRFWVRKYVSPLARGCKEMFVIVDKEKEDTDLRFGTDSVILTKSIDFRNREFKPKDIGRPIRFVYTGSLAIGRDETIAKLADSLNRLVDGEEIVDFKIYSQTTPKNAILSRINRGCSHFMGTVPHQEIERILNEADVVIFAEAIEGKKRLIAKLSFSTKITDYLAAGKCILAIGDREIAPIDYFDKNNSAIIATNLLELECQIDRIIRNPSLINEYGKKAFDCAVRNHEKRMVDNRFINTMCKAVEKDYVDNKPD